MHAELHAIVDELEAADPSQKPEAKALGDKVDALDKLHDAAEHHLVTKTPWHERNILLRAQAADLGLNLRDKDLAAVVATARARLRGQKKGIRPGDVFQIARELGWTWPDDDFLSTWLAGDMAASLESYFNSLIATQIATAATDVGTSGVDMSVDDFYDAVFTL